MLLGLIWVQTVCKDYQQTALVGKELTSFPVKITVMYLDTFEGLCGVSKYLTLKAPPIICSRRQFQILSLFQNNK